MSENGWGEYKRLLLDDREENKERFKVIEEKLADIALVLERIETQKKGLAWVGNVAVPTVVSASIVGLLKKLGF